MVDNFPSNTVFLSCKRQRYAGSKGKVARHEVDTNFTNKELHILEEERSIVVGSARVLPRAQQKEESQGDHIHSSLIAGIVGRDHINQFTKQGNRNRLDSMRRWITARVELKLAAKTEVKVAKSVPPQVRGPHAGHRLANRPDCIRNCARPDGLAGGSFPLAIPTGEDLKEGNGIGDGM